LGPEKKAEVVAAMPAAVASTPEASTSPAPDNKSKVNLKMFLYGMGGFVLLVLVILLAVTLFRVYHGAKTDRLTSTAARIMRLPAGKINGVRILYSDYAEDMQAIKKMRDYDMANNGPSAGMSDEKMSEQVLLRLGNNELIVQAAKEYGLKVEQKDIDNIKAEILKQFKSEADANNELMSRYGWDLNKYINKVVKSYLLQQSLAQALAADQKYRTDILSRAMAVLGRIKAGEDFAKLAKEFSEDSTGANGGDLGWFKKEDMVPQFATAAFALKKGQLSKELVETEYGFHIIRLDDRKFEKGVEMVKARHILFRFQTLERYLTEMAKKATVHLYINVTDPFAKMRQPQETAIQATSTQE